jgi:hypothetical protein
MMHRSRALPGPLRLQPQQGRILRRRIAATRKKTMRRMRTPKWRMPLPPLDILITHLSCPPEPTLHRVQGLETGNKTMPPEQLLTNNLGDLTPSPLLFTLQAMGVGIPKLYPFPNLKIRPCLTSPSNNPFPAPPTLPV